MADYTTLADLKAYLRITGSADDTLLSALITRASALIDDHCGRTFSARTETRTFDADGPAVYSRVLLVDDDLLSVSEVIVDGEAFNAADYGIRPQNLTPGFGIVLKRSSGKYWSASGDPEGAIRVTGQWGFSSTPPAVIVQAALRLAAWLYRQRDSGAEPASIEVTPQGVAVAPARLPRDVLDLIEPYVRVEVR